MNRRALLSAAGAAAALAGCAGVLGDREPDADVGMTSNRFRPAEYRVEAGDSVVWGNGTTQGHTVTAYAGGVPSAADYFASGGYRTEQAARDGFWAGERAGVLYTGDTYEHTFAVPGTYAYFCIPHERAGMVGSVVVEE